MVDPRDDWGDDAPPKPPKQGMSTFAKFLLVFVIVAGIGVVVCCGVCGFLFLSLAPTVSNSPQGVAEVRGRICEITLPEVYQPKSSMESDSFFALMRLVVYQRDDGKGSLVLRESQWRLGGGEGMKADQERELDRLLENQEQQIHNLTNVTSETRTFQLRGQEVEFEFMKGEDAGSKTILHQVRGNFTGNSGMVTLTLELEDSVWNQEEVDAILNSIR